jgi:hypothetical protein
MAEWRLAYLQWPNPMKHKIYVNGNIEAMHDEMSMPDHTAIKRKFSYKNMKIIKFHQANEKY